MAPYYLALYYSRQAGFETLRFQILADVTLRRFPQFWPCAPLQMQSVPKESLLATASHFLVHVINKVIAHVDGRATAKFIYLLHVRLASVIRFPEHDICASSPTFPLQSLVYQSST